MKTVRVIFEGRVQGVGFRYSTKEIAKGFDLLGTVRNLPEGTVELIAAANEAKELKEFIEEISMHSELSHHVTEIHQTEIGPLPDLKGFTIVS